MARNQVLNRFEQPEDTNLEDNKLILAGSVETGGGVDLKLQRLILPLGDISSGASVWILPGFAGTIVRWGTVIDGAIITAAAGLELEIAGVEVTGGGIAIVVAGSAAGVVDFATPSALNVFTAIQPIEVVKDGLSTNAVNAVAFFELLPA